MPLFELINSKVGDNRKVFLVHGGIDTEDRELARQIAETTTDSIIVASYGTFSTGINIIWLKELKYTMKKTLIMNSLMSQSRRVMDKTEFLAAIKLVSGEELLSMVTSVHDDNGDYLIVENPIEVEEVMLPNKQAGAKVQPWMKFSREEQFVIPKDKIITIVEVAEEVAVFYHMSLRKLNTDFITDAKGKISTVDEARIKLNKIFNKDS